MVKEYTKTYNHCQYCNSTIIGPSYKFMAHLFTHEHVKPRFKCKYCSKKYFRRDVFSLHVKKHEMNYKKRNLYFCAHCDRGFINKRNLIYHLKHHNDLANPQKYRFYCTVCRLSYSEKRILIHHIRKTHFNNNATKPVYLSKEISESWVETVLNTDQCVEITKLNNNLLALKKSAVIETGFPNLNRVDSNCYTKVSFGSKTYSEVQCHYCEKVMFKKSIRKHIEEVHLHLRKFKCKTCNRTFSRRYQMSGHIC